MKSIKNGVWPTMVTPYKEDHSIDYDALEKLIDWYITRGVIGLFAVCQSSEMFFLSLRERLELAKNCVRISAGRVAVVASGHVADSIEDQIREANMMAETGVDAVVLISNRFAGYNENDDVFKRNLERFLKGVPSSVVLGFYECPAPYKRLLSPDLVRFAVDTERFGFLKDTSCNMDIIKKKLEIIKGTDFKLFNANSVTLLASLQAGISGFSGVMANFHPDLYAWICKNWAACPEDAKCIQHFIGLASIIEYQLYPINAMYALSLEGLPIQMISRRADASNFSPSMKLEVDYLMEISHKYSQKYKL
jgi:4-hydroxy-tetrahydrodipicolinate synthase